ncbi:MAG: DUF4249 domain-containing protein [Bacteroidales bacterium]
MKLNITIVFTFILILCHCSEPYDPLVEVPENILVVEGLITDATGPHYVSLFRSTPFNQQHNQQPLENAEVYVMDNTGHTEMFNEIMPGCYQSSADFRGMPNREYTLKIITPEGEEYRSSPQLLIPVNHKTDSLTGVYRPDKIMETPSNEGEVIIETIEAIDIFGDVRNVRDVFPRMRFEVDIMLQYRMMKEQRNPDDPSHDPPVYFCRIRNRTGGYPNITKAREQSLSREIVNHNFGFIPKEKKYYQGTRSFGDIVRRIVIIDHYSLNEAGYNYYRNLEKLISAEGKLFDPVAVRLDGNVFSADDNEKTALGFFEVSGKASASFAMNPEPFREINIVFEKTHDLDHLPRHECFLETIPPLWVY